MRTFPGLSVISSVNSAEELLSFHLQSWFFSNQASKVLFGPVRSLSRKGGGGLGGNQRCCKKSSETCFPLDNADFFQLLHSFSRIIISCWKITSCLKTLIILRLRQEIQYVAIAYKGTKQTCITCLNYSIRSIYYSMNIGNQCVNNSNNGFQLSQQLSLCQATDWRFFFIFM